MELEKAIDLVMEVKNCSLPWEDRHYEALDIAIKCMKDVQSRQNIEWSEEDETGWTNTMIMIKECAANHYTKDSIALVVNWLNSLKDRVIPQPKQEWSDEDLEHLEIAEESCQFLNKIETVNWLKSLRTQKQWKPTEEQMNALQVAAHLSTTDFNILSELLEQLKQL